MLTGSSLSVHVCIKACNIIRNEAVYMLLHPYKLTRVWTRTLCCLQMSLKDLQEFAAEHLPPYQVPKSLKVMTSIPRNAMGKINKKALVKDMVSSI